MVVRDAIEERPPVPPTQRQIDTSTYQYLKPDTSTNHYSLPRDISHNDRSRHNLSVKQMSFQLSLYSRTIAPATTPPITIPTFTNPIIPCTPEFGPAAGVGVGVTTPPPTVPFPGFKLPPVPDALAAGSVLLLPVVAVGSIVEPLVVMEIETPLSPHSFSVKAMVFCRSSGEQAASTTGRREVRKPWLRQMQGISVGEQPVEAKEEIAGPEAHEGTSVRDWAVVVVVVRRRRERRWRRVLLVVAGFILDGVTLEVVVEESAFCERKTCGGGKIRSDSD